MGHGGGGSAFTTIIYLIVLVAWIAGLWKAFEKAGKPGWAAIIPIYNIYVLLLLVGKPWWWLILMLIPLVGIVVAALVMMEAAVCFGKSKGWGLGLLFFLGFIGWPMIGFGEAKYSGPASG